MTLTDFLLARIAEDEAVARIADHHDLKRELAECEAKRRIVGKATSRSQVRNGVVRPWDEWVLEILALPYADHPDYREEWKL